MTSAFKNRLIGSSILIIAAIVFLPDLLDGQKQVVKDEFKAIPQRPEFSTVQQEQVFTKQQLAEKQQELLATPVNEPAVDASLPDNSFAEVTAGAPGSEARQIAQLWWHKLLKAQIQIQYLYLPKIL